VLRVLRVTRGSARKARTQALNQMRALIATAPDEIRAEPRDLNIHRMLKKASSYRPAGRRDPVAATKYALRARSPGERSRSKTRSPTSTSC